MPPDAITWLFGLEQFGIKLGLESVATILQALGRPDRSFLAVHVGGTNGKGSVTAMLDAALRHAGHRTGRYTSPHLRDLRERFVVDGVPVASDALAAVVSDIRSLVERLADRGDLIATPTFFEVTTAAALELFRRSGVEVAVCEVGLGGRLDATNVLHPLVSAITSIGADHQQQLGSTLTAIAGEKAGILKPAVPVVVGRMPEEARIVIAEAAADVGSPMIDAAAEVSIGPSLHGGGWEPTRVSLATKVRDYGEVTVALRGAHQVDNAAVAVRVLETMDARGVRLPADAIVRGLATAAWPGRLERRTYADGRELILDAAHNPEGAVVLAAFLRQLGTGRRPLVFAAMRDKDIAGMLKALLPVASRLIATQASNPRSEDPATLAGLAHAIEPGLPVAVELEPSRALDAAWRASPSIVVAGSIFLLGDVMNCLEGT